MTKVSVLPKETLAELLYFLAENESFNSVEKKLNGGIKVEEVRAALRELARELSAEATAEDGGIKSKTVLDSHLSDKTSEIISLLSADESEKLFSAFKLATSDEQRKL